MYPIRLTDNHYINPNAVAEVEFRPAGTFGTDAFFSALHTNTQYGSIQLRGREAEEAFENWTTVVARKKSPIAVKPYVPAQYQDE